MSTSSKLGSAIQQTGPARLSTPALVFAAALLAQSGCQAPGSSDIDVFSGALVAPGGRELVFLVDGSGSISAVDWQIQKDGLSAALQDAAMFPRNSTMAVGVVQWSFVSAGQTTRVEVPLTLISDQASVDGLVASIQGMAQLASLTNPGDGIRTGTNMLLGGGASPSDTDWILCMSTDGVTNSGESLASATAFARASQIDKYSVIGIEDPGFADAATLRAHYNPHVFGDGAVSVARNSIEFANFIAGACLGKPVQLRALEVNQSIQDWQNSIPLITNKETGVRAFVQVPTGEPDQRVVGRLHGRRGGLDLPGSPLVAINAGSAVLARQNVESRRAALDDSLNFALPANWRSGTVELEFETAGAPLTCLEPGGPGSDPANNCRVTISFQDEVTPEMVFVAVRYQNGATTQEPTNDELIEQMFRFNSILPIAGMDYRLDTMGNYASVPDLATVNTDLAAKRLLDISSCSSGCTTPTTTSSRYYGVLRGIGGGLANGIPGMVSSGFLDGVSAQGSTGYARNRGPHELGHSLGRHHAVDNALPLTSSGFKQGRCGEFAASSAPGHSPFELVGGNTRPVLGPLTPGVNTEVWGLDTRFLVTNVNNLAVIDPRVTFELMSYCSGGPQARWISQFTYTGLRGAFPASGVGDTSGTGDYIVVVGTADLQTGAATFGPTLELTGRPPTTPPGNHRVQLLDAAGVELAAVSFVLDHMDADAPAPGVATGPARGLFVVPVPRPAAPVAAISVLRNGTQVGLRPASARPPTVSIVSPAAGQNLGDPTATLAWSGGDPDGDPVTFTVLHSADDGNTWNTLVVNTTATSIVVSRRDLAASASGRLRVIASDGVNTASATSGQFTVANNQPLLGIDRPRDRAVFSGLQNIDLVGAGFDAEDGAMGDTALTWSSDLDGAIGSGREATVNAADLTPGTHVVTLTANDHNGASATASVRIRVFRVAPPPNRPPVADAGDDQTLECTAPSGVRATLDGSGSTDPEGAVLTYQWSAPGVTLDDPTAVQPSATFPLGTTTVSLVVDDGQAASPPDTVGISVRDTVAPRVTARPYPQTLWPPNQRYVPIRLTTTATDVCDAALSLTATAWSDQPDNGLGDGNTTGDVRVIRASGQVLYSSNASPRVTFDPARDRLELRAERAGSARRTYTIEVTATDDNGNRSTTRATVVVQNGG
jgi:hypothetical protein